MPGFDTLVSGVDSYWATGVFGTLLVIGAFLLVCDVIYRIERWWINKKWAAIQVMHIIDDGYDVAYKQKGWTIFHNYKKSKYLLFNDKVGTVSTRRPDGLIVAVDSPEGEKVPPIPKRIKVMWDLIKL